MCKMEKDNPTIEPLFAIQYIPPALNQCRFRQCHRNGAFLEKWHDYFRIFVWWGYIEISPHNTFIVIIKHQQQPWMSQNEWQLCLFLAPHALVNNVNFITQCLQTMQRHQGDKNFSQFLFSMQIFPGDYVCWFKPFGCYNDSGLPFMWPVPRKHFPKALWMCRANMWLENGNEFFNSCLLLVSSENISIIYW
jgi:hypothetical protein